MKKIIFLISLLISHTIFSTTVDTYSIPILGTEMEDSFTLSTIATPASSEKIEENKKEQNTILSNQGSPTPNKPPVPPSNKILNLPKKVKANFKVRVSKAPNGKATEAGCSIQFLMDGEKLYTTTTCRTFIAVANSTLTKEIDQNGSVIHNYDFKINLVDLESTLLPLAGGLKNMHIEGQTLIAKVGDLSNSQGVGIKILVSRKKVLKSDEILVNKILTKEEYSFVKTEEKTGILKIDLQKLIGGLNDKKHQIKLDLDLNLSGGAILNTNLPSLHQSNSISIEN